LLTDHISRRSHHDPYVLTGDFNAGEGNTAMRYLRGEMTTARQEGSEAPEPLGLRDTYRVLHPANTEVGTFNGFEGTTTGEKIDAVLISERWDVRYAAIVRTNENGRYPSDHFPVVATLQINP
jgi:endonuclease/exonuclease/phosphatase family metal-dependent hydrolase